MASASVLLRIEDFVESVESDSERSPTILDLGRGAVPAGTLAFCSGVQLRLLRLSVPRIPIPGIRTGTCADSWWRRQRPASLEGRHSLRKAA